jgi:hypothetical protein
MNLLLLDRPVCMLLHANRDTLLIQHSTSCCIPFFVWEKALQPDFLRCGQPQATVLPAKL